MPFTQVAPNTYQSPSGRKFTKKQVKMYYATSGFTKKKVPIIKKKLKGALGETDFDHKNKPIRVKIDVKRHKGDRAELASTIKHELMHVKHPKMTEKEVYKRTAKTKIPMAEQSTLISKLRDKKINQKVGSLKRKFKMKGEVEPGAFISKMNEKKVITSNTLTPKTRTSIMGLI